MTKKDNTTLRLKAALRREALTGLPDAPVVLEAYGGYGAIWSAVYREAQNGCVFEKDPGKAAALARQRPGWAVYEGDCVAAMRAGAGAHLSVNLLDIDPYGDPWPAISAFFESERPRPARLCVVVNDGLRQKVRVAGAWHVKTLAPVVARFGNDLHARYLEVCEVMMQEKAAQAGYSLVRWVGYYCGRARQMTHYLAVLQRSAS